MEVYDTLKGYIDDSPVSYDNLMEICKLAKKLTPTENEWPSDGNEEEQQLILSIGLVGTCLKKHVELRTFYFAEEQKLFKKVGDLTPEEALNEMNQTKTQELTPVEEIKGGGKISKMVMSLLVLRQLVLAATETPSIGGSGSTSATMTELNPSSVNSLQTSFVQQVVDTRDQLRQKNPFVLSRGDIKIFENVTDAYFVYVYGIAQNYNAKLSAWSSASQQYCEEIADAADTEKIWGNKRMLDEVLQKTKKAIEEKDALTPAEIPASYIASARNKAATLISSSAAATFGIAPNAPSNYGDSVVLQQTFNDVKVKQIINSASVSQPEQMSVLFRDLCNGMPDPGYFFKVIDKDLFLSVQFGNTYTMDLFEAYTELIAKAQTMNETKPSKSLSSVIERSQVGLRIIKSSGLFKSLDRLRPGLESMQRVYSSIESNTERYGNLVDLMSVLLPISKEEAESTVEISIEEMKSRAALEEQKRAVRIQKQNEWIYYGKDTVQVIEQAATITKEAIEDAAEGLTGLGANVANDVLNKGANITSTAAKYAAAGQDFIQNQASSFLNFLNYELVKFLPLIIGFCGAGAAVITLILYFKMAMNPLGRNPLADFLNRKNALPPANSLSALPAPPAQSQTPALSVPGQPLALLPAHLPESRRWKQMVGESTGDLLVRRRLLREEADEAMKLQHTDNPNGQFDEPTLSAARLKKYNPNPGGGTLKRKKRTRKQKRRNRRNTKVRRRTSGRTSGRTSVRQY